MSQQQALQEFVNWWRQYCKGYEKGEGRVFLERLFRSFGHPGVFEAGGVLEDQIKRKREGKAGKASTSFADLVVPGKVQIIKSLTAGALSGT